MEQISRKPQVRKLTEDCLDTLFKDGPEPFLNSVYLHLLTKKVRFPLLEYSADLIQNELSGKQIMAFMHGIAHRKTIGGNVIIGKMLQNRLSEDLKESFQKAADFIEQGSQWYVTDIIGERVYGNGLLLDFKNAYPEFRKLKDHPSSWVVRAIGPGAHFATKRKIESPQAETLFRLLLELSDVGDSNIRSGIGWAAKTIAKFHPDIIESHSAAIEDKKTGTWFRRKVRIGLERNAYAKGN